MNDHVASKEIAKLLTVFIGEAMKRDAHFLYQDREGVFAFGSSFWSIRSYVFVFTGLRFCYNFSRRLFVCLI